MVLAEETALEMARRAPRPLAPKVFFGARRDAVFSEPFHLVRSRRRGKVEEALVESPTGSFALSATLDGSIVAEGWYPELERRSPRLHFLTAFEEDGLYFVHLGELEWLERADIVVIPGGQITFKYLYAQGFEAD